MVSDLPSLLSHHALTRPDAPALADGTHALTHGQLRQWVLQTEHMLAGHGVKPGDRVAMCADNCVELVVAMLACLQARCSFIPLPYRDPSARLDRLLSKSRPELLLIDTRKTLSWPGATVDLFSSVRLCDGTPSIARTPAVNEFPTDTPAYIIFTSGSTGEPKGVCIPAEAFWHAIEAARSVMDFGHQTRSLLVLPLHFDASFSSLFPVLAAGASVHIYRGPLCLPEEFLACFDAERITHTTLTPSYLRSLVASDDWSGFRGDSWQTLATGGEVPARDVLRGIAARLPGVRIYNRYGPTEATMAVCSHLLTHELLESDAAIPIGKPHDGVEFVVLDPSGNAVSGNEAGELHIGGAQLMMGYLDSAETTAAVLRAHPTSGKLLYRTGDIVTIDGQGNCVYLGRANGVIKRNGLRISLSEVDEALLAIQHVTSAACVSAPGADQIYIVAFITSSAPSQPTVRMLRKDLLSNLPACMLPDIIHILPTLPVTGGGKTDRKALQDRAIHLVMQKNAATEVKAT